MSGNYTKHIYIGSQRIVSKLGDLDSYGSDPRRIEYAGANVDGAKVDYKTKYTALQQTIKDRYAAFEVPYLGKDNDDYVNGQGFCCDDTKTLKSFTANANDNPELFQYYYHSDHLGSSSLITNLDGEIVQHIEYMPFGEVFIEERNNTWNTPYLFNAKELDEETGLYYYGARYYDPRVSIFFSVDQLVEQTGTPYQYCYQNPVNYVDPTGMAPSTDVTKNGDGTYTVVNAHNDNDKNIYVVDENKKRTGEIIGETLTPYDFLYTNDSEGTFSFDKEHTGVTFDLDNLTVSGRVRLNPETISSIRGADADALIGWGQTLFLDEVKKEKAYDFYSQLKLLKRLSANGEALDFKVSLGLAKYTPIKAGETPEGLPVITTLRAVGNITFGKNMRLTEPPLLTTSFYYKQVMKQVGAYNQKQNNGNGYNSGFPYYGEHTYSGSFIYKGFWGHFNK